MAKRIIKNENLKKEWDADLFFESKSRGCLIAAITPYLAEGKENAVPVVFMDKKAAILVDADTAELCTQAEVIDGIKEAFKNDVALEDCFPENYICITDGVEPNVDALKYYGLNEDQLKDIEERLDDLINNYWIEILESADGEEYE